MANDTFHCPECGTMLRYAPNLQPGTVVRCPQCEKTFPVPDPAADPALPPAEAPPLPPRAADGGEITTEPGAGPRPPRITDEPFESRDRGRGRRYPDEDDEDYPRDRENYRGRDADAPLSNDYEIDINKWFGIAGAHYSAVLGPAVGFMAILFAFEFGLSLLGSLIVAVSGVQFSNLPLSLLNALFITPALQAGFLIVFLKQLDGRRWSFGDFFAGFHGRNYLKLIGNNLLLMAFIVPLYALMLGGIIALAMNAPEEISITLAAAGLLGGLVAIYFLTRMFYFSIPLIVDRGFGPIEAIKGSWTLTAGHFWGIFGVSLLIGVIAGVGVCACYIGALFSIPYALLIQAACYLDVAGLDPPLRQPVTHTQWRENG